MNFEWTDAQTDKLVELVLGGKHSFSRIGAELGCGKNGAIGKWHRIRDKRDLSKLVPVKPRPPRAVSVAVNMARHWTEADSAALREMYMAGAIFSDIAVKLGRSAAACHGRAVQMGLPSRGNNNYRLSAKGRKRTTLGFTPRLVVGIEPPSTDRAASIVDVTGCRWAITDHDSHKSAHMFCNHDTALGKSYCQYHELMKVREKVAVTAVKRFVMPTTQLRVFA